MEILRTEYIEKVHLADGRSRNVLLFTEQSIDEITLLFAKRKAEKVTQIQTNVISLSFKSAIKADQIKIDHFLLYSSFKKNDDLVLNEDDKRNKFYINHLKKIFDDAGINVAELKNLSKEQFFKHYPQEFLSQKMITVINTWYTNAMYKELDKQFENINWKPFQQTILDICNKPADERAIYIIEDVDKRKNNTLIKSGNIGKSFICNKLDLDYNVIIADGKKDNIFNQIKTQMDKGNIPNVIILDVPRQGKDYINYGAL